MAETQPPSIVEGATTGDVDDEIPVAAKSAEDRKAAAALSSLDAPRDDESSTAKDIDREAVRKAMDRLAGAGGANGTATRKTEDKQAPKKLVKVDAADVTLLVCLHTHGIEQCQGYAILPALLLELRHPQRMFTAEEMRRLSSPLRRRVCSYQETMCANF